MGGWTRETICAGILARHAAGGSLSYGDIEKEDAPLLRAAMRYFGSWKRAVEVAGLDYDAIRRYRAWSRELIVERIQQYHAAGEDLSWRNVATVLDPALAAAAVRPSRFATWAAALQAAGLSNGPDRRQRSWEPQDILAELRRLHDAGHSLRAIDAARARPALVAAARRRFGGWYDAVTAAGLDEAAARTGPGAANGAETTAA
jgi:hypothetical protein